MKNILLCLCFMLALCYPGCKETYIYGPETLVDPSIVPMVIYTYPPPNSQGPYDPLNNDRNEAEGFVVRFNKLMDAASVKRSISISSNRRSISTDSSRISGSGEVYKVLPVGLQYEGEGMFATSVTREELTVTVATTARDVNGNYLRRPWSMKCVPEPHLRLRKVLPESRVIDYYGWGSATVQLEFTSAIRSGDLDRLQWTPNVVGEWRRDAANPASVRFNFAQEVQPDTMSLSIPSTIHDDSGNVLSNPQSASFTHGTFHLVSTSPYYGAWLDATLELTFSKILDTSTVARAFAISPSVDGVLSVDSTGRVIRFDPSGDLNQGTYYRVTIDTSLRSRFGDKLPGNIHASFPIESFRLTSSVPELGETNIYRLGPVSMSFNNPIDTGTVRSAFALFPSVPGRFEWIGAPITGFRFRLELQLPPGTVCSLFVSTDLKTRGGTPLPLPSWIYFKTQE
jgi:hypothetical protein